MYHSVNIGEYNTWDTWGLIPSSRPIIAPPSIDFKFVNIPGASEEIDMTREEFGPRDGSIRFIISRQLRPRWKDLEAYTWEELMEKTWGMLESEGGFGEKDEWHRIYTELFTILNGEEFHIVLEDDPNYYYLGKIWPEEWAPGASYSEVSLHYIVQPYKRLITDPTVYSM